jgi:hypothetical protein
VDFITGQPVRCPLTLHVLATAVRYADWRFRNGSGPPFVSKETLEAQVTREMREHVRQMVAMAVVAHSDEIAAAVEAAIARTLERVAWTQSIERDLTDVLGSYLRDSVREAMHRALTDGSVRQAFLESFARATRRMAE